MKLFLDTSAFAKRCVAEQGSVKVLALCQQANSLVVSVICLPELISTLFRLVREKKLGKADYQGLKAYAMADLKDVDVCQMAPEVVTSALSLLEAHPLRAMDALHLACALAVKPDLFVSADQRQLAAAKRAGLKIADVGA